MTSRLSTLVVACLACSASAALAEPVEAVSNVQMELRIRGDFVVATPGAGLKYKLTGPGRLVLNVAFGALGAAASGPPEAVDVELLGGVESLGKQHVTVQQLLPLVARGAKPAFSPVGFSRIAFELPARAAIYELKVSAPVAVAAFRRPNAPSEVRVPELPVKPEGKAKPFPVASAERWHWASVCDRVSVRVPGSGVLKILARTQLDGAGELPPPSFLRAVEAGHVRMTTPITAAAEPGYEFGTGRIRYGAGTQRELTLPVPAAGEYDFELAAWGCVNGVGMQFDFTPGPVPPSAVATVTPAPEPVKVPPATPVKTAAATAPAAPAPAAPTPAPEPAKPAKDELAQCMLMLEDLSRVRVAEYLDTMMASGVIPSSRLVLQEKSELGSTFAFQSVTYVLDGLPLHERSANAVSTAVDRQVVPGPHTLEVRLTLKGQGTGKFQRLADTTYRVSRKDTFVTEAGKRYGLRISFEDRGGFATPMKERPAIGFALVPDAVAR